MIFASRAKILTALPVVALLTLAGCGGGGGGGTPTSTSDNTPVTPPSSMGATDPDALLGVLWDDDGDPANDDVAYEFKTGYTIPGVDAEGRASYIDEIVRDAEYARRTAVDIGLLIDEIREGRDHEEDYRENYRRPVDQYGHKPGESGASLKEFVDAGGEGVAVLVRAQGISKGIADAALDDIEAIEAAIARIDAYREKAEDAKKALEDEARRLREVEIVALIGRDGLGGSAGEKLDESMRLREQARGLEAEISMLQDEFDGLEVEVSELQTWLENPDLLNLPVLASSEGPACDSVATCRTVWEDKRKERDEKKGEIDSKKESMTEDGVMTTRANRLVKMADDLLAESEADEQKADDLRKEADRLETTEAQGIQDEIDSIRAEKAKLQKELENDGTDGEALGDKNDLAREDGAGYDLDGDKDENRVRLESRKAQNVLDYLEGQFKNATASDAILLGEGANFSVLRERERDDKNSVFARAEMPRGTVDAWAALGLKEDEGMITITVPTQTSDPNYSRRTDIALLFNTIGEHRALRLEGGKPDEGDFTLADTTSDQANYAAATGGNGDIGVFFEGTYKGVHGTLYVYDWNDPETGLTEPRWFFTPTTARGEEGIRLRGRNPELFRYMDEDGDGTFELVSFVDYGMWLEGDTTLILRLLAGIVGPQESVDDLGTVVDVHGVRDRDNPHLDATATYSGTAKGLSARRTDGVTASGHFEADVSLSATFGADATLEGRIDNFRSADPEGQGTAHVNSDWRADLDSSPLADRNLGDTDGNPNTPDEMEEGGRVVKGTVSGPGRTSGEWSGVAYGKPGRRPDGFYGGFRLEFGDGAAAGVFDAPKVPAAE